MHLRLSRRLRNFILCLLAISLVCAAVFIFRNVKYPGFVEEKKPVFSYSHNAGIDYKVSYVPNMLTKSGFVAESASYISKYVNSVEANFTYNFTGDQAVDYQGEYFVLASIVGKVKDGDTVKTIWKKDYELMPKTTFRGQDKTIALRHNIPLKYQYYNSFTEKFLDETKIKCDTELYIAWYVNLAAKTAKGPAAETISANMIIPLNVNYFTISGNRSADKKNALEETIKYQAPLNRLNLTLLGMLLIVSLTGLIYIFCFTDGSYVADPVNKRIKTIFKEHGDRLVGLASQIEPAAGQQVVLRSWSDLIKVADELGKPVMYRYDLERAGLPSFYVFDEPKIYAYELRPDEQGKSREPWFPNKIGSSRKQQGNSL